MDVARVATGCSCLVLTILFAGCSSQGESPRPAAPEPTPSSSARSYSSDEADAIDTARSSAERDTCRRATVRARRAMEWPLIQAVDLVASDVDGRSAEAAALVRRSLERVPRRTEIASVCDGLPRPTAALLSAALRATREPVGIRRLAQLERAFNKWSAATGART